MALVFTGVLFFHTAVSAKRGELLPDEKEEIAQQVEKLKSTDPKEREAAAIRLFHYAGTRAEAEGFERVIDPLLAALEDPEPGVRGHAAMALGRVKDHRVVDPLLKRVHDENKEVRKNIVAALGEHRGSDALEAMSDRLWNDPETEVRWAAAYAFRKFKPTKSPGAISALVQSLRAEKEPSVREAARGSLQAITGLDFGGDASARETGLRRLKLEKEAEKTRAESYSSARVVEKLGSLTPSPEMIPIIESMTAAEPGGRSSVIPRLEKSKDPLAAQVLVVLLEDEDSTVRSKSAKTLVSRFEDGLEKELESRFLPPIVAVLRDENKYLRRSAARILGYSKDPGVVATLLKASVDDEELTVKLEAESALVRMGSAAFEKLFEALKNPDWRLRRAAVRVLGSAKNSSVLEPLSGLVQDENMDVRKAAQNAVDTVRLNIRLGGDRKLIEQGDFSSLEALEEAMRSKEAIVRRKAAAELGAVDDPKAVELLVDALLDGDPNVGTAARNSLNKTPQASKAVEALIMLLEEKNPALNSAPLNKAFLIGEIIGILREKKDPRSVPVLSAMAKHHEELGVRQNAIIALSSIGTTPALKALIPCLDDETDYLRGVAAGGLEKAKDPELVEPLLQVLQSPKPESRETAHKALVSITGEDFQLDIAKWMEWWQQNGNKAKKAAAQDEP